MSLSEKAKTGREICDSIMEFYKGLGMARLEGKRYISIEEFKRRELEEWVRLEDHQQDKQDTLKTAWSTLEDECKRIQDEIDRGCYFNPLDIIFEVHVTVSKCFEVLLRK